MIKGAKRLEQMYFSPVRAVMEKMAAVRATGADVVSFGPGEPDFNTPSQIKEETIKSIEANDTHYAPNRGFLELRQEISKYLEKLGGVKYDPETEIILTAGGAEAINNAFLAFVDPGDEVITFSPAFMNYENMTFMTGGKLVSIPLTKENDFQIDPAALRAAITDKTKMIVINNPGNPTGVVYSQDVLEEIAKIAIEHDLLVFSDEIYAELTYGGAKFISIASLPGMKERTITMSGFSKAFAMTGWRLGILCAPPEMLSNLLKIHQYTTTCTPTFIQKGLIKAMNTERTRAEVNAMCEAFARRRQLIMDLLDEVPGLSYTVPTGAFYIFVDVSGTGLNGDEYADKLLETKYVGVVPGSKLGKECINFVRLSYATSDDKIREGLRRMKEFSEELLNK